MNIFLAVVLGTLFGFVLQRIGAADPDKIIGMLRLKDLHLMKVIFAGIGVSSIFLFLGLETGVIDPAHLSIKGMYPGVIFGGLLLGFGWALSGYCPGTGVVAAGSGKFDGLFFIAGGLTGAWFFAGIYRYLKGSWLLGEILGGKSTLVVAGSSPFFDARWAPGIAVLIGIAMIALAKYLPVHPQGENEF